MRVLLQWTTATPSGWWPVDSEAWASLPAKPEPTGGETLDDAPGWIYRLNVQGVEFTADHYAVEPLAGRGCRVSIWNDDPEDYPPGERFARVWTFLPLAPDPRVRRQYNTRQAQQIYADAGVGARMIAMGATGVRPFEAFALPPAAAIRHGIWVPEALNVAHNAARPRRGWREWSEGVPAGALDARGHVRPGARG